MNQFSQKALLNLTGKASFDDVSTEELEHFTASYPYFSVAHLLLAAKYKHEKDSRFDVQVVKAALYQPNAWWLNYHLNFEDDETVPKPSASRETMEAIAEKISPAMATEPMPASNQNQGIVPEKDRERVVLTDGDDNVAPAELLHIDTTLPDTDDTVENDSQVESERQVEGSQNLESTDITWEPKPAEEAEERDPRFEEESKEITNAETVQNGETVDYNELDKKETPITPTTNEPITEEFSIEEIEDSQQLAQATLSDVDENASDEIFALPPKTEASLAEEEQEQVEQESTVIETPAEENPQQAWEQPAASTDADVASEETIAQHDASQQQVAETTAEKTIETPDQPIQTEAKPLGGHLEPVTEEFAAPPLAPEDAERNDQMLKNIQSFLQTTKTGLENAVHETAIPVDPYHTVDYFASQGIKLVMDAEPSDVLGKKLKKFTQWLRHMKKLGPEDALDNEAEQDAEATVIRIADFSNTQREVLTEAMAEVLAKQGKAEKAVQIYIKLSFLEPDKSAYFADKIKILKGLK